jgi:hypothetical protein
MATVWRRFVFATVLVLGATTPCGAQIPLVEGVLKNVTDVGIYASYGWLRPTSDIIRLGTSTKQEGLYGYGLELSLLIGAATAKKEAKVENQDKIKRDTSDKEQPDKPKTTYKVVEMTVTTNRTTGKPDTTLKLTPETKPPTEKPDTTWLFELSLGYGQLVGFQAQDPTLDLRGTVREFPTVSVYASSQNSPVYFGIRSGLIGLHQTAVYEGSGRVESVGGQTFSLGGVFGLAAGLPAGLTAFAEAAYTLRYFPNLDYKTPQTNLPASYPRTLNFSGFSISAGFQIEVNTHTGK